MRERKEMTEEEETINRLEEKVEELYKKNNKLNNVSSRLGGVIVLLFISLVRMGNSDANSMEKNCFYMVSTLENNIRKSNITNIDLDTFFDSDERQNWRNCYNE